MPGGEAAVDVQDAREVEGVEFAIGHAHGGVEFFGGGQRRRADVLVLQLEFGGDARGDRDVRMVGAARDGGVEGPLRSQQAGEQQARIVAAGEVGDEGLARIGQGLEHFDEAVVGLLGGFFEVQALGLDGSEIPVMLLLRTGGIEGEYRGRADLADALPQAAVFVEDAGGDEFMHADGVELCVAQLGEHGG